MRQGATAGRVTTALAGVALVLAGCSSSPTAGPGRAASATPTSTAVQAPSTTTTEPLAAPGTEARGSAIPWSRVGPGWMVALWGPHAAVSAGPESAGWDQQPTSLYLVDPVGGRYLVTTLPAPSDYSLSDWSGDGRRILLLDPGGSGGSTFDEVDLSTGRVLHTVTESEQATARFTRPTGQALLVGTAGVDQAPATLVRTSWSGSVQVTYPNSYPGPGVLATSFLPGLDGTQLVVGASTGMALVDNDGTFVRAIGPPGQACSPTRWWDAGDLVAACQPPMSSDSSGPSLWIVPVGGQPSTQLTNPLAPDYGDVDAWPVGAATYVQALGGCGSEFLAQRNPDGTTSKVTVPGATDSVQVIGADHSQLALPAQLDCGSGETLFWFDPAGATETPLLGPQVNGGCVLGALPYPGLQS